MNRLLASVSPGCRVVWLAPGCAPVTGDLLRRSGRPGSAWRAACRGARVGVLCREPSATALAFLALDGLAAAVSPLPREADPETLGRLVAGARLDLLVTDAAAPAACGARTLPPPDWADLSEPGCAGDGADTEWVIPTSGTTRRPKLVAHTLDSLTRTVKRDVVKGAGVVWGLVYDLNRFAGLQVFFQALLGGSTLVFSRPGDALPDTLRAFAEAGVNALSATPTLWRKILMTPESAALDLRRVTLGGEIADAGVLAALASRFPAAKIVHIYASTEAGVGFAVADGRPGFPAAWLESGVPGARLRVNAAGILELRPDRAGQRYLGESEPLAAEDGFVNTGDRVAVSGDRVHFFGRDSGAINVGGLKVQPEQVEAVLLEHPAVVMAAVGAKRSGITGSLVEARVVLRRETPDRAAAPALLRDWCAARLERHQVPALIRIVDALDPGASGKIVRR